MVQVQKRMLLILTVMLCHLFQILVKGFLNTVNKYGNYEPRRWGWYKWINLRPRNTLARGVNGKSSGSVSWLDDIAKLTHLVEQGGSR